MGNSRAHHLPRITTVAPCTVNYYMLHIWKQYTKYDLLRQGLFEPISVSLQKLSDNPAASRGVRLLEVVTHVRIDQSGHFEGILRLHSHSHHGIQIGTGKNGKSTEGSPRGVAPGDCGRAARIENRTRIQRKYPSLFRNRLDVVFVDTRREAEYGRELELEERQNVVGLTFRDVRSEERRVGKECRSRW